MEKKCKSGADKTRGNMSAHADDSNHPSQRTPAAARTMKTTRPHLQTVQNPPSSDFISCKDVGDFVQFRREPVQGETEHVFDDMRVFTPKYEQKFDILPKYTFEYE